MQLAKALLAQSLGLLLAFAATRSGLVLHFPLLIGMQALTAAMASHFLGQAVWWRYIHLVFAPAAVGMMALQLPSWLYLAAVILLGLVFWGTPRGEVPLYLSSRQVCSKLEEIVTAEQANLAIDLGAGTGSVAVPLAKNYPQLTVEAWELAPIPWSICKWRSRHLANLKLYRRSFWECDLSVYDVVYAFLSPAVMPRLGEKAWREMRPGTLLVSSAFPVPDWEPESIIAIEDHMATRLFCYRIPRCPA